MARVFTTGSADGLGLMTGRLLAQQGHAVVLHARNEQRAADTRAALPEAEAVVTGDLSTLAEMRHVADQAGASGRFDAGGAQCRPRPPRAATRRDGRRAVPAVGG